MLIYFIFSIPYLQSLAYAYIDVGKREMNEYMRSKFYISQHPHLDLKEKFQVFCGKYSKANIIICRIIYKLKQELEKNNNAYSYYYYSNKRIDFIGLNQKKILEFDISKKGW